MISSRTGRARVLFGFLVMAALGFAGPIMHAQERPAPNARNGAAPSKTLPADPQGKPQAIHLPTPSPTDRQVAEMVAKTLEQYHLTRHRIDDEMSRRTFRTFFKELDPTKVYFEQRDIDEFKRYDTQLDDLVLQGDMSFAYEVLKRFLVRVRERLPLVEELVKAEHDFTQDEYLTSDYDNIDYVRTPEELHERWRKKVKYDLLLQRLAKKPLPAEEQKEKVLKRYRYLLHRMEQTDSDELLEMYLNAVAGSYDPHSSYMSPTTLEDFNISMRLHLDGIGARLKAEDGFTIVAEVLPGGAADRDGRLKVEDKIIGVAQGGDGVVDVVDMKLTDVVKLIRGPRDTKVELRVLPAGKTDPIDYTMTRAKISLTGSEARAQVIDQGKKPDGKPYRIGYIDLPSFYMDVAEANSGKEDYKSCTRDVRKLLQSFENVDAVMLDLRNNGGGALTEAINLVGLFIDRGPVVQVKEPRRGVDHYDVDEAGNGFVYRGPLVVLVSKLSASASEIFAGAIQDYDRGLVVGDQSTHGKGTVQTVLDVGRQLHKNPQLGALKLTIQQFYRVNGDSTQNRGVLSDVVLPSIWDHMEVGESHLPNALPFEKVDPVPYRNLGWANADLKKELQELSDKRRASDSEFRKLDADIERIEVRKQRKSITLNEDKLRLEMSRNDKADENNPDFDQPKKANGPVFERTFYYNECLAVTEDFLRLGAGSHVVSKF